MGEPVTIREVGPRDGLQPEAPLPVGTRVRIIEGLTGTGLRVIEAAAFVSAKRVPSMADADKVFTSLEKRRGVTYFALVPNVRGTQMALQAGVEAFSVTLSVSDSYSTRNVGMSRSQAEEETFSILELLRSPGATSTACDVVLSCAFGSPYGERIEARDIVELTGRLRALGATVTLADTTGEASPRQIERMLGETGPDVGLHFHDSKRTALLNAYVALSCGCRRFDASVGGLGGSPFAVGSAGNLATEELVRLAEETGYESGVDLEALLEQSRSVAKWLGRDLPSPLAANWRRG